MNRLPYSKICGKCKEEKLISEYYKMRGEGLRKSDYNSFCKYCHNRRSPKEQVMQRNAKARIKREFGLSIEEYRQYFEDADYKCSVCDSKHKLVLDHCHSTGIIRGVLCHNCNTALGHVKDNILILKGLINFLEKSY